MPIPTIQGQAGLTKDPELKHVGHEGKPVLELRLAFNDSKWDDQQRKWVTAKTFYVDASIWEDKALRLADILTMGDQVYVEGRIETQSWEKDGDKRSKPHLMLRTVRKFEKAPAQQQQSHTPPQQYTQQATQQDPWGGQAPAFQGDFQAPPQGEAPPF